MAIGLSIGQVALTAGAIYTVGASETVQIRTVVLHNNNTTTETVSLYFVPNNGGSVGTATEANRILNVSIASGDTFEFSPSYPVVMDAQNDTVQAVTTTASEVTYLVLGRVT